jgi:type I restriction enzyme S subunit
MMRLRFADAEITRWVAMLWPSRHVRSQIEQRVKTTAGIYKIAQPQLASIKLPMPPLAKRREIVAEVDRRLSIVRGVEAEVEANLKRAQALRQAVLARAFSGEPLSVETAPHSNPTAMTTAA